MLFERLPQVLLDVAQLLEFLKDSDTHDDSFSVAVLEDSNQTSPTWRDRYLAADKDNTRVNRARAATKVHGEPCHTELVPHEPVIM